MKRYHYSFTLDHYPGHELKDGSYPVLLVVRKENKRMTINTGLSTSFVEVKQKEGRSEIKSQWNKKFQRFEVDGRKELHPDRAKNNKWLDDLSTRCDDLLNEFDKNKTDWTLNQFRDVLLHKSKKNSVESYFSLQIDKLDRTGKIGNKNCYQRTLHMLKLFDSKFDKKVFTEMDLKYINRFDEYLKIERRCAGNTVSYYMRTFRALLNRAIKEGEASEVTYPFGKNGYSIASLAQETEKRYLPSQYIETLKTETIDSPALQWSRNLFLFSYYCQGMAIVDMASLTDKNIMVFESGKYICYRRAKTESKNAKIIRIKITQNIQNLLDWFKINTKLIDNYLLPVITIKGYEGQQLYNHIRDRNKKLNKHLKTIGKNLNFEGIMTSSYQSRHSYAMRLKNSGIPEDVISEAMGHKDLATTKTYLDSFQNDEIAEANKLL